MMEPSRRGWRRRTGDFADLCHRCASAYEDGMFCESFHLNASGWRCCESCGKQIHCGCIVSFHMFVLLDAGGIECMGCARKSFVLTPNPAWPPPFFHNHGFSDKVKDLSVKNWSSIAGSGPVPWREAPSWFNNNTIQVGLNAKMPSQAEVPGGIDGLYAHERVPVFLDKNKKCESSGRPINGSLKTGAFENEVSGIKYEEQPTRYTNVTHRPDFSILEPSTQTNHFGPALNPEFKREIKEQNKVSGMHAHVNSPPAIGICFPSSSGVESSGKAQAHDGNPRWDGRVRSQLPPRNRPKITNQELQEISGHPSTAITPLFEKTLSASDAGRIGRLVLPKKGTEAYLPEITNPEGIPLMMQDMKGNEWVFQFRFWPNNNSRMYVLEGVTACIQSMQLVAGDTVTFSRLEPEGKLVMGGRKASTPPTNQSKESINTGNEVLTRREVTTRASKPGEDVSAPIHVKDNMISSTSQANSADPASRWSEVDRSNNVANDVIGDETFLGKRKNGTLGSKSKCLRIGNDQIIELEITLKEVQGLFRPPSDYAPQIVVIDGYEIAEFEEPPVIGRPTILATDCVDGKFQWAQCEDCFKWRRVPGDILLPSRWTCYKNSWDRERSFCSAAQELTPKELEDLLITAGANKINAKKEDEPDPVDALEGLDELANLAINEENGTLTSSKTTTKHPRHRPGCTCIVCIQPPSGMGPKHKQTCTCNVCLTVKRRFHTIMSKRENKQTEKETETKRQKLQQPEDILLCSGTGNCSSSHEAVTNAGFGHDPYKKKFSESPFKGQIDLNRQPEREEDMSPFSDSGGMVRLLQNATEGVRVWENQQTKPSFGLECWRTEAKWRRLWWLINLVIATSRPYYICSSVAVVVYMELPRVGI
ncbi:Zinc finger-type transcription factor [Heracleum sosnowskyi]|uniref:Zinc finger-type transcription factor n=1 Tax=Heracleum sosnowskyi TaxID=360622 RepID=A0AAD8MAQ0_9APIA|nr:Zinc finger-type transcription factor [Heracleum sosnowskyi]